MDGAPRTARDRTVVSADGTRLAIQESGDPSAPTVVAVHGYPDHHTVWDGVVAILSARFHVVTYDVRGAGGSDKPTDRAAYRMERLVEDLSAVVDAVSPDEPVHLLAHDWGSIQTWPSLTAPGREGRYASYTSISGPSLDHAGAWVRDARHHPGAAVRQLLDSYYIGVFHVPGLAEKLWRSGALDGLLTLSGRLGRGDSAHAAVPDRTEADKVNGLELYRANIGRHVARPAPTPTDVPVQVLAPTHDIYVSAALQTQAPVPWARRLHTRSVHGGHWVVSDRPDVVARCVTELVDAVTGGPVVRELRPRSRTGRFAHQLAVVTGGGRGIGRATALELAREGADVVLVDLDADAAAAVADEVRALGVEADHQRLDVSDADGWETFARWLAETHGTPDVVVNNAGIGMGGPFLGTTVADWRRVLDVNLWGVVHGCRLLAAQMVARGQGGQVVTIASAAGFAPSRIYPAYATSKAAVLMLTECLRPELRREGIGVTAICPGFVDTDISATTVHVGVDADEQARRREHAVASYARRGYTPERLARHAVRAAARNRPVAAISAESKLFLVANRTVPPLGRLLARLDLNKL
ncbi:SDR family oxidoreductase [Rhodococcus aerolatus]